MSFDMLKHTWVKKALLAAETDLSSPLDSIWNRGDLIERCYREEMMI
jgi:hypothetical protein